MTETTKRVVVGLGLYVLAILCLRIAASGPTAPEPAAITKTADSLDRTRPALDSQLVASSRAGDSSARVQRELEARERAARLRADRAEHRADSLATLAAAATSPTAASAYWHAAYAEQLQVSQQLRGELVTKEQRITALIQDTVRLAIDKKTLLDRNVALETHNANIRAALAKANTCTIVWRVRCPSRKQTAAGVIVVEAAAAIVIVLARP